MSKSKLEQYSGPLSAADIAAGMNAAKKNASRLARDARLLFENERYASAQLLAILSIEEAGKTHVLRELALARDAKELRERWRDYRSHVKKNVLWPTVDMFLQGARRAEEFKPLVEPDAEHTFLLDKLKQLSIYTDCLAKGHWSVPEHIADEELAQGLLRTAELFCSDREVTTQEIELWIQYLQPAWKTSLEAMKRALFEWDTEMRKRGLLGDRSTMEEFFTKGIEPSDFRS